MKYRVIGPCEVGGVAPGGVVTEEQLVAHGATRIDLLIGPHLEPVSEDPPAEPKAETKKAAK